MVLQVCGGYHHVLIGIMTSIWKPLFCAVNMRETKVSAIRTGGGGYCIEDGSPSSEGHVA